MADNGKLEGWAIISQMGHRTLIGEVRQVQIGEAILLRVDVPEHSREHDAWNESGQWERSRETFDARVELVGPSSIYSVAIITKEAAMKLLASGRGTSPAWVEPKLIETIPTTAAGRRLLAAARGVERIGDDDEDDDGDCPF